MSEYSRVFKLTMGTGNDAFEPESSTEIARILREVADQIERHESELFPTRTILDGNGNSVGVYWHKATRVSWIALSGDGS